MQQCVYQMTFGNDYEFKKRLEKCELVCIIDTAVNEWRNHLHVCVCTVGQLLINFIAKAEKRNNWMKCQPKCQKCEQNVFLCII